MYSVVVLRIIKMKLEGLVHKCIVVLLSQKQSLIEHSYWI